MQQVPSSTTSTLQLVAADMTDIMENLDTRELDLDLADDIIDGHDGSGAGTTESVTKPRHLTWNSTPEMKDNK